MLSRFTHIYKIFIWIFLLFSSCMNDELWLERDKPNLGAKEVQEERGLIILNEGNFNYGNASISYYNLNSQHVENDVFYRQNGVPLGDVAHSAIICDGLLYTVVNNSGKVVIMNLGKYSSLKAFEYTGKISGLNSPRYVIIPYKTKGYISDLYARKINIFNPETLKITSYISTHDQSGEYYRHPAEQMIMYDSLIFTNCYSYDDQILIINTVNDQLVDSIRVLKQPSSMVSDKNNKLWVLCDGGYEGSDYKDEFAGIVRIDMASRTVEKVFIFPEIDWPGKLCINGDGDMIYYINRDIWKMSINSGKLPETPFISANEKLFTSLAVDPLSSEIYAGDAIDYVQQGVVYRFNPEGIPVDTIRAGVNPGFFVFTGLDK